MEVLNFVTIYYAHKRFLSDKFPKPHAKTYATFFKFNVPLSEHFLEVSFSYFFLSRAFIFVSYIFRRLRSYDKVEKLETIRIIDRDDQLLYYNLHYVTKTFRGMHF